MPYRPMVEAKVRDFLAGSPPRTAKLATVRADGRPHVAPVWYVMEGDTILFNTGETTVKGRNLRRDPRASICVDDDRPPFSFVVVEGTVDLSDDPDDLLTSATLIGARYMGAERAEEFGARNGVPGELVVRLLPERVVSAFDVAD